MRALDAELVEKPQRALSTWGSGTEKCDDKANLLPELRESLQQLADSGAGVLARASLPRRLALVARTSCTRSQVARSTIGSCSPG
jgi:hypothetical protein